MSTHTGTLIVLASEWAIRLVMLFYVPHRRSAAAARSWLLLILLEPYANNQRLMVALLYAAKERVVITTPYFVPDEALLQAIQAAILRGVEVHLVVSHKADQVLVGLAQRFYYEELLAAGVRIHEYRPGLLHAKHISVDDSLALIGSSNMDIRSFSLNAEISLIVYDRDVVGQLRRVQEQNLAESRLLTAQQWAQRSLVTRMLQNTARLFDSVL